MKTLITILCNRTFKRLESIFILSFAFINMSLAQQPMGASGSWNMVFDDEFSSTTLDQTKWRANWGNAAGDSWTTVGWSWEVMDSRNLKFPGDGSLHIQGGPWNDYGDTYWHSGCIQTSATFQQTYGFYEARIKMAPSSGFLNAFWLAADGTWPPEIDIDETLGNEPNTAYYHTHYGVNNSSYADTYTGPNLTAGFHIYGCEWNASQIIFYFDGVEKARQSNTNLGDGHACNIPMFILLNIHIGNSWAGYPTNTTPSSDMVVDYVRSWKPGASVSVTGVTLSPTSASLSAGSTQQLTATVSPSNASNKSVNWNSSNTSVATVNSSGLVTGVATGTSTITVTTVDGSKTATSSITVTISGGSGTWTKVDDTNSAIAYSSGWSTYAGNGGYQNTEHYTYTTGATATYTFTGTQARFYGFKGNDLGIVEISVDGVVKTTIDCFNSSMLVNQMLYETSVLTSGSHTLKVRCTGTKNASSANTQVIVDAFEYTNSAPITWTKVDDTNSAVAYSSGWSTYTGNGGYQNTEHYIFTIGATATFTFTGTKARFYGFKRNDLGIVEISVDGVVQTTIDCYNSTQLVNQMLYETAALTSGSHTLKVKCTGTKNASASNYQTIVDAFEYTTSTLKSASIETALVTPAKSESDLDVKIYPNPITEQTAVWVNSSEAVNVSVNICNVMGQIVWTIKTNALGDTKIPIDLTGQAKGIYVVKVQIGDKVVSKTIVK